MKVPLWLTLSATLASVALASPAMRPFRAPKSAKAFLRDVDEDLSQMFPIMTEAEWKFNTNLTDENQAASTEASLRWNKAFLNFVAESRQYNDDTVLTEYEKRLMRVLQVDGSATPTDPKAQADLTTIVARMTQIYSTATVDGRPLTPDLESLLANSRDAEVLKHAYIGWRDATGPRMKADYEEFVRLINAAAREGGFENAKELWLSGYDMPPAEFEELLETTWSVQLLPLYEQLHCYVRTKLTEVYGEEVVGTDGYIPGHLLGDMFAQDWTNIYKLVAPYPGVPSTDVTEELQKQGYTAVRMHKLAEEFYTSIGFDPLPSSFWTKSMLVKPSDRDVVCHASAWDFLEDDLRIKMCTQINHDDLVTIHHEQGHLMYDHAYREQHYLFRAGAADFFHEAIGDTIALSVVVPRHLKDIGLLPESADSNATRAQSQAALINYQMQVALSKIAILPWALLVDKWRWSVFDGSVKPDQYNRKWWDLIRKYQGIKSPAPRADDGFDPGSKFHIPNNTPYARYFGAAVLQFQLHQALCQEAGQNGPLHDCSIYKSKKAGRRFLEMLQLGRREPWQKALAKVIADRSSDEDADPTATLDAWPLVAYFKPLERWLRAANVGKQCGWPR